MIVIIWERVFPPVVVWPRIPSRILVNVCYANPISIRYMHVLNSKICHMNTRLLLWKLTTCAWIVSPLITLWSIANPCIDASDVRSRTTLYYTWLTLTLPQLLSDTATLQLHHSCHKVWSMYNSTSAPPDWEMRWFSNWDCQFAWLFPSSSLNMWCSHVNIIMVRVL